MKLTRGAPDVCTVCGREWQKVRGWEGAPFTLLCDHDQDEQCWHPGEKCEYWYAPTSYITCMLGRTRQERPPDHAFVSLKYLEFSCKICHGRRESPSHPGRAIDETDPQIGGLTQ